MRGKAMLARLCVLLLQGNPRGVHVGLMRPFCGVELKRFQTMHQLHVIIVEWENGGMVSVPYWSRKSNGICVLWCQFVHSHSRECGFGVGGVPKERLARRCAPTLQSETPPPLRAPKKAQGSKKRIPKGPPPRCKVKILF